MSRDTQIYLKELTEAFADIASVVCNGRNHIPKSREQAGYSWFPRLLHRNIHDRFGCRSKRCNPNRRQCSRLITNWSKQKHKQTLQETLQSFRVQRLISFPSFRIPNKAKKRLWSHIILKRHLNLENYSIGIAGGDSTRTSLACPCPSEGSTSCDS